MQDPNTLSDETLTRLRDLALAEVAIKDQMEIAVQADDGPRVMELAKQLIGLEMEVKAA